MHKRPAVRLLPRMILGDAQRLPLVHHMSPGQELQGQSKPEHAKGAVQQGLCCTANGPLQILFLQRAMHTMHGKFLIAENAGTQGEQKAHLASARSMRRCAREPRRAAALILPSSPPCQRCAWPRRVEAFQEGIWAPPLPPLPLQQTHSDVNTWLLSKVSTCKTLAIGTNAQSVLLDHAGVCERVQDAVAIPLKMP